MTQTPWGPLGLITYKRTYARNDNGVQENFADTVDRILHGAQHQLKCNFTPAEVDRLRNYMLQLKGLPAGRFLWQLGTKTVDKLGMMSLMNCNFTSINKPIEPFTWAFDSLMLGNGVGYSVQREHVYELPKVRAATITRRDTKDADFIVPDSREGWVELLRRVLESHFKTGKSFSYSTVCVRGKGTPIEGFGGQASGPEPLAWGIDRISLTLNARSGKKIRSIDALDIMNIIGYIVVSGNVRRSAQIALGDYDDELFLKAKRWDLGAVPNWRAMSNNTVICSDINQLPQAFWDSYTVGGEPIGLFNKKLSQSIGRTGEAQYSDKNVMGTNPCGEVSLENWETCVTGDTKIQTKNGVVDIKAVVGKKVKVFNGSGWSEVVPFLAKKDEEFLKISFNDGSYLKTTKYHEFSVSYPTSKTNFRKIRADNLEVGMYLPKFELPEVTGVETDYAYTLGAFAGDGYMDSGRPLLCCVEDSQEVLFSNCKVGSASPMWKDENRVKTMYRARIKSTEEFDKQVFLDLRDSKLGLPNYILSLSKKSSLDFLAGWIDTDGSIRNKGTEGEGYIICGSELKIRDAQLLCRRAGINFSTIRKYSPKGEVTNYGIRNRDIWVIQIPTFESAGIPTILKRVVKTGSRYKSNRAHLESKPIDTAIRQKIVSIEVLPDTEDSFCFSEPINHMGVFGNVLTYQCCLSDLYLSNISSKEELFDVSTLLYRINKHAQTLPSHQKKTEEINQKNMRVGIGVTGYLQATEEQRGWLNDAYNNLRDFDSTYSAKMGFNPSIKLTTIKPSGTLSLLAGTTSGCHPGFSQYYIRRIRIASNSPLATTCRAHGYPVEFQKNFDGSADYETVVVEFPCRHPEGTVLAKDLTAIQQMEFVRRLQREWADNAVSCTVYFRKEELPEIQEYLKKHYKDEIKSISFLLHSEHGFIQAPLEEISYEEYERRILTALPISDATLQMSDVELDECLQGHCPVR